MKRARLALGAMGSLLLLIVGCTSLSLDFDLGLGGADAAGSVRIMDGPPEVVAVSLQDMLGRKGIQADILRSGDTVVVTHRTTAGLTMGLALRERRAADGRVQTEVALQWQDDRKDQQLSGAILAEIDRQTGGKK